MAPLSKTTPLILPDDLNIEIIKRLPVKSIMRFKLVSKRWYRLIRSPFFIMAHIRFSSPATATFLLLRRHVSSVAISTTYVGLLRYGGDGVTIAETLQTLSSFSYIAKTVCCSNGVVCLNICHFMNDIVLWNPTTRELRTLPQSRVYLSPKDIGALSIKSVSIGFAYYPDFSDYKTVQIVYYKDRNITCISRGDFIVRVEVFTKSTNTWRDIEESETNGIDNVIKKVRIDVKPSLVSNGVIYWTGSSIHDPFCIPEYVVEFDVINETFRKIRFPSELNRHGKFFKPGLVEWNESIILYGEDIGYSSGQHLVLWKMNRNDRLVSWTKMLTIESLPSYAKVLAVGRNDGTMMIESDIDDVITFYDISSGEVKKKLVLGGCYFSGGFDFVETLAIV